MNQTNIYIEGSAAPKRIPAIVPMAYQAVAVLQDKVEQVSAMNLRSNAGTVNVNREDAVIPLWNRYSLSVPEAAKYFGIGEGRLYQIIAEHPGADFILEVGSHVKIKRVLFERYLDSATCV